MLARVAPNIPLGQFPSRFKTRGAHHLHATTRAERTCSLQRAAASSSMLGATLRSEPTYTRRRPRFPRMKGNKGNQKSQWRGLVAAWQEHNARLRGSHKLCTSSIGKAGHTAVAAQVAVPVLTPLAGLRILDWEERARTSRRGPLMVSPLSNRD